MSEKTDLTSVASNLAFLEDLALEIEQDGWSGIGVDGNDYVTQVVLADRCLWCSEDDDRAYSDEKDEYTETVVDCVLRALEAKADFYKKLVIAARNKIKLENTNEEDMFGKE